jgi:hypothetical protein
MAANMTPAQKSFGFRNCMAPPLNIFSVSADGYPRLIGAFSAHLMDRQERAFMQLAQDLRTIVA